MKNINTNKLLLTILAHTIKMAAGRPLNYTQLFSDLKNCRQTEKFGTTRHNQAIKKLQQWRHSQRTIYSLQRSKYIAIKKLGDNIIITLTDKGILATIGQALRLAAPLARDNYIMVIFDIPESQRHARDQFRHLLKQSNFTMLQQSVWVSQQDVYEKIVDFIKRTGVTKWINIYHATKLLSPPPTRHK